MRQALVTTQLLREARNSGPRAADRQPTDAPPEAPAALAPEPRPGRLATLLRRARALVVRPT
jgi:hypothetical protein